MYPFDGVWREIQLWLESRSYGAAKAFMERLVASDPQSYSRAQLRGLRAG